MRMSRKNINEIISASGIKITPARIRVLDTLINSKKPLTVEDVAKKLGSQAHLATIYRTLEKFVSVGIFERVDFQEGKFRYEYVHDHHHHAVCDSCHTIVEIKDSTFEKQINKLNISGGFNITRHAIEFFGLCGPCQKKGNYVT